MKRITNKQKSLISKKTRKIIKKRRKNNRRFSNNKYKRGINRGSFEIKTDLVKTILEENGFAEHRASLLGTKKSKSVENIKRIIVPVVFSVSEDSDKVIAFLRDLYDGLTDARINKVIIDHTSCKKLGLSASTFMDIVYITAKQAREEKIKRLNELYGGRYNGELSVEGVMSHDSDITKILIAGGLPRHINAPVFGASERNNEVEPLDVITGISEEGQRISARIATRLTNYFNVCLKKEGLKLSDKGVTAFTSLFGEVLTNCETHGGKNGTWYTQGVYLKHENEGELQLMFMNIGDSIYERLQKNCSNETRQRLEMLLEIHKHAISEKWTKEMLFTLFTLQDGISRFRDRNLNGHEYRGNGTVTMIEVFQALGAKKGDSKPQLTIVSGRTKIVFDEKYKLKDMSFADSIMGHGKRKVIAFNADNNIYKPADHNNVMQCNYKFPGTVVSLRFTLNKEYVRNIKEGRNHE